MEPTVQDDMEIQALVFDARRFDTSEAKAWARANGFVSGKTYVEGGRIHIQQERPEKYRRETFRQMTLDDGVQSVIAAPKRAYVRAESVPPRPKKKKSKSKPFSWKDPIGWAMEKYL